MFGETANKLIIDAKRASKLSEIPLYQGGLVKDILKEISDLNKDAEYLVEIQSTPRTDGNGSLETEEEQKINQCQLFVTHLSMRRNKRCLLAYEKLRAHKIDEFAWLNKDPTIQTETNKNILSSKSSLGSYTTELSMNNLNHAEQEYMKNYQDLLMSYKSAYTDIDLSGDLEPPTNIFIDVRVLKDGGEVQTEYGVFNLIKNSQFYVRKSDVERLIQQGYLEEI